MLKFIVDYLQYLKAILYHVQKCLNGALAIAAVVNVLVTMFVPRLSHYTLVNWVGSLNLGSSS